MYVACVFEAEWFIGVIKEVSDETDGVYANFMKQDNQNSVWSSSDELQKVTDQFNDILSSK